MTTFKAEQRTFYRDRITVKDLIPFSLTLKETDLLIFADTLIKEEAKKSALKYRHQLEEYIKEFPAFLHSLNPLPFDENAPPIVKEMMHSAIAAQANLFL